jgi:hypothetical protein
VPRGVAEPLQRRFDPLAADLDPELAFVLRDLGVEFSVVEL